MVIAALEGALQEYRQVISQQVDGHHIMARESQKKPVYAWSEIIMMIMQSLWMQMIGAVRSVWGAIRTWVELLLIVFECSELVHKLGDRFNLWRG